MRFQEVATNDIDTIYDIVVHCKYQAELECQEAGLNPIDSYPYPIIPIDDQNVLFYMTEHRTK